MKAEFQITYFLWTSRADKEGLAPVYIRSKQNAAKQIPYNTGVRMHPLQWNKKKNEPKNKPVALVDLERNLKETYKDLVKQGFEPDLNLILEHLNDSRKPTSSSIVDWCEDYIKSTMYSEGQRKGVRTLKTNLEGFNKHLSFDKLTKPVIKSFFEHLTKNNVANNSQSKRLTSMQAVANHADIHLPHLENYKLPYETNNALKVRLNWEEVKAVMNTETVSPMEAAAKDVFLLACFSGLRISDILTLQRGELHEFYYERVQTKTKKPVLPTVHKYNEKYFKKIMNEGVSYLRQNLSDALKKVLERSGMTKEVIVVKQVGNNFKETVVEKYKEIAFHSGRRFYSRLLTDLGLGGEIARDELGHSFKNITDLYAGSPEHSYRVARVRKAMEKLEETLQELTLMKVA